MKIRFLAIVISCIVLASPDPAIGDDSVLPAWFWDTPQPSNVSLAVGYSPPYADSPEAFNEAFEDAAWRLYKDAHCRIAGERGIASCPEGIMSMGGTMREFIDSSGFEDFASNLVRIDSVSTQHLMAILVATSDVEVDESLSGTPPLELKCRGLNICNSSAPIYYHYSSSWVEAEHEARMDLAMSICADMRGVSLYKDDEMFKTSIITTDIVLCSVKTLHRRIDSENGIVKVWVTGSPLASGDDQP